MATNPNRPKLCHYSWERRKKSLCDLWDPTIMAIFGQFRTQQKMKNANILFYTFIKHKYRVALVIIFNVWLTTFISLNRKV